MACNELDDHEEVLLQDNRIDGLLLARTGCQRQPQSFWPQTLEGSFLEEKRDCGKKNFFTIKPIAINKMI
ncbi:MAG: hypothetical protein KJP26_06575 [Maribacter sp.]|nr:hypothetical protein [Maribacter sp.]